MSDHGLRVEQLPDGNYSVPAELLDFEKYRVLQYYLGTNIYICELKDDETR